MIFAVVTTTSLLIYDTQFAYPLVRINGCHLATINDVAWSSNGQTLVFCSSDGYVSFVRFDTNELGIPIPIENVPNEVKQAFPSIYLPNQMIEQQKSSQQSDDAILLSSPKKQHSSTISSTSSSTTTLTTTTTSNSSESTHLKRSLEENQNVAGLKSETNKDEVTNIKKKKRITPITEPITLNLHQHQTLPSNQIHSESQQSSQNQQSPFKIFGVDPSTIIDLTEIAPVTTNFIVKDPCKNGIGPSVSTSIVGNVGGEELKTKTKKRITPILGEITTSQIPVSFSSTTSE